ncbi:MAG: 3D domain-containing protein, partial [Myxococcota bacterium]
MRQRRLILLLALSLLAPLGCETGPTSTGDAGGTDMDTSTSDTGVEDADTEDVVEDTSQADTSDSMVDGDGGDASRGDPLGTFWTTYYYLAYEENYSGPDDTTLYGEGCTELAQVPAGYGDAVCIEGSGKLEDGTVINYAKRCTCGGPCNICFAVMDPNSFPWGQGSRGNALEPLRSWAVDTDIISHGTVLYVEEWDGVEIPAVDGLGGFTHDGCFRADDVGGGINGMHFDFFAGTPDMRSALEQIYPTRSEFVVYENS